MTTTVLDAAAPAAGVADSAAGCRPATCRVGLLGLGYVGSAFARHTREDATDLAARGFSPVVVAALVRTTDAPRAAARDVSHVTADADAFFAQPLDVVVEVLGGVEPANALVRRALDRGIPVVTANKSLIAAYGDELTQLARRRATALRYEASCIAGVPFLGFFERRPLAARASGVTAILNGTSNSILTAMTAGATFEAALAEAQRLGLAEPDPTLDISGADAAEKLAILVRVFGQLLLSPSSVPLEGLAGIEPDDIAAAAAFDGAIKPIAHASWHGQAVDAFVGPAFVGGSHPLARVRGVSNGIVIDPLRQGAGARDAICLTGPGAGPDVTARTLLDDVAELVTERRVRTPSADATTRTTSVTRPSSAWFVRLTGSTRESDVADLLGAYGIWSTRLSRRGGRTYALTCPAGPARLASALDALGAATGAEAAAFPAIGAGGEEASC